MGCPARAHATRRLVRRARFGHADQPRYDVGIYVGLVAHSQLDVESRIAPRLANSFPEQQVPASRLSSQLRGSQGCHQLAGCGPAHRRRLRSVRQDDRDRGSVGEVLQLRAVVSRAITRWSSPPTLYGAPTARPAQEIEMPSDPPSCAAQRTDGIAGLARLYNIGGAPAVVRCPLSVAYNRRTFRRPSSPTTFDTRLRDRADPRGNELIANLNRAKLGLIDELTATANQQQTYNGVDVSFSSRFAGGGGHRRVVDPSAGHEQLPGGRSERRPRHRRHQQPPVLRSRRGLDIPFLTTFKIVGGYPCHAASICQVCSRLPRAPSPINYSVGRARSSPRWCRRSPSV